MGFVALDLRKKQAITYKQPSLDHAAVVRQLKIKVLKDFACTYKTGQRTKLSSIRNVYSKRKCLRTFLIKRKVNKVNL